MRCINKVIIQPASGMQEHYAEQMKVTTESLDLGFDLIQNLALYSLN